MKVTSTTGRDHSWNKINKLIRTYIPSHMHSVYRHSFLNVAAAASKNGGGGLYYCRVPQQIVSPSFRVAESRLLGDESWRIFPSDMWDSQLLHETLYTRGWVFQERMLSPRLVHFGSKQIFWDCATKSACEILPHSLPEPLDAISATERHWRERLQLSSIVRDGHDLIGEADDSVETLWRMAVKNYTSCSLTKSKDKLIACWSIAKLVRDMLDNNIYAAGMWSVNLHKQLAWKVLDYTKAKRMEFGEGIEVPSWSWASIDEKEKKQGCPIWLPHRLGSTNDQNRFSITGHDGSHIAFKVKEEADEFKAKNDLPELEDPRLAIRGHIFRAFLRRTSSKRTLDLGGKMQSWGKFEVFPDVEHLVRDEDGSFMLHSSINKGMHSGLDFGMVTDAVDEYGEYSGSGLILECIVSDSQPIFQRTGSFTFRALNKDEWKHVSRTDGRFMKTSEDEIDQHGLKLWLA
jgi:hypothetical protein